MLVVSGNRRDIFLAQHPCLPLQMISSNVLFASTAISVIHELSSTVIVHGSSFLSSTSAQVDTVSSPTVERRDNRHHGGPAVPRHRDLP